MEVFDNLLLGNESSIAIVHKLNLPTACDCDRSS